MNAQVGDALEYGLDHSETPTACEGTTPPGPKERRRFPAAESELVRAGETRTAVRVVRRSRRGCRARRYRPGLAAELVGGVAPFR